jgi:hypothetical protein
MPSAGHEVHRKEPDRQLGAGFVEDSPGAGVDVVAALLAGVGPPLGHRVKSGPHVANLTMRFLTAVLDFHDPGEAGRVIRILGLKLLESVFGHDTVSLSKGRNGLRKRLTVTAGDNPKALNFCANYVSHIVKGG